MVKSPHHVSKDLFGESQPAAARKPVAKSLFKEPSAPLETRAQVPYIYKDLFGDCAPAAARKPVAKSLFKEPSATLETRAQVHICTRICLARASQLRLGSRWLSRSSRSRQPLWRLEHRYISKDLFGESQPAVARKPVAKSLFKEPSAPLEARAQVYVTH